MMTLISCKDHDTVHSIADRYVKSIGGENAWHQVNTIITTGEFDYGGIKFPFTAYSKAPNLYKFVVPFNGKFNAQAFDETTPTLLSEPSALAMANEADVYLMNEFEFLSYDLDDTVFKVGVDTTIDAHLCSRLLTRTPAWLFDKKAGDLIAKKTISKNPELKGALLTSHFSDYRSIDAIKIPFKIIHETNGQVVLTITVDKVLINKEIANSEFRF